MPRALSRTGRQQSDGDGACPYLYVPQSPAPGASPPCRGSQTAGPSSPAAHPRCLPETDGSNRRASVQPGAHAAQKQRGRGEGRRRGGSACGSHHSPALVQHPPHTCTTSSHSCFWSRSNASWKKAAGTSRMAVTSPCPWLARSSSAWGGKQVHVRGRRATEWVAAEAGAPRRRNASTSHTVCPRPAHKPGLRAAAARRCVAALLRSNCSSRLPTERR